jgi:hypothetical protein
MAKSMVIHTDLDSRYIIVDKDDSLAYRPLRSDMEALIDLALGSSLDGEIDRCILQSLDIGLLFFIGDY